LIALSLKIQKHPGGVGDASTRPSSIALMFPQMDGASGIRACELSASLMPAALANYESSRICGISSPKRGFFGYKGIIAMK
jgi:hypothetical protein